MKLYITKIILIICSLNPGSVGVGYGMWEGQRGSQVVAENSHT